VSISKLVGVSICFIGAVLVGVVDDGSGADQTVAGDIVALISAIGYGLYTTLIRYYIEDEEEMPVQLVLGFIGLVNIALLLLPIIVLVRSKNYLHDLVAHVITQFLGSLQLVPQ
jgi:solute carrier family 35, member F5